MAASFNLADFQSQIMMRYFSTPSCASDLKAQFTANYNNWYVPRVDTTNGIPSVQARWNAGAKVTTASVMTNLPSLTIKINTVLNTYGSLVAQLINPNTGIFAGLDCTVIGEDFELAKNAVCVKVFNSLYVSFELVSIVSYLLIPVTVLFVLARKDEVEESVPGPTFNHNQAIDFPGNFAHPVDNMSRTIENINRNDIEKGITGSPAREQ